MASGASIDELPRVVEGLRGQQDLSALGQRHQPGRDVGRQADDVLPAGHVHRLHLADVDAHAGGDRARLPRLGAHATLEDQREAHGVAGRGERGEVAVAGVLDDLGAGKLAGAALEELVVPRQQRWRNSPCPASTSGRWIQ